MGLEALRYVVTDTAKRESESDTPIVTDSELLARIAREDHAAFATLLKRHLDRVLAFVERTTGCREDAEEIVQESFLRVWNHAARWDDRGVQFSTWLHQVALNLCRDRWRRQKAPAVELEASLPDQQPGPESQMLRVDQSSRVRAALLALPERQRVAIVLSHYQGLSNPETAEVLKCSVEAVESLLGRARRQLRKCLLEQVPHSQEPQ